jgi:hypothetical protein
VVVAVDNPAHSDFASERFGQNERVEAHQQSVILGELVEEAETDRNELGWLAPTLGWDALNGV